VTRILQQAGFNVVEAATGAAGLKAIAVQQPALIILDVKLPDLSGFEVCRQIKANPGTAFIPVLHLSASFIKSQDKAEGLDSGADAYLTQPVEPLELVATVRSLLRIRRAEDAALASAQEWQTTFDAINDSVGVVDQEGRILRCNQAMSQLLGRPLQDILGYPHQELMLTALGSGNGACFRLAKATCQRQVLELQTKDCWLSKTMDPVLDEQGAFAGAVFILSDITERKRAEALLQAQNEQLNHLMLSLQQQTEEAQQANRIKDEFLAVLSHELRSPLNPILGWVRILQTSQQDKAKTQYALETIERNAKLQAQLIEDLLDVSRILRGKVSLHMGPVGLPFIVKAALETVRLAAEAKAIQIQTVFEPQVGQVLGDSGRLQQVVWNLLSNAVKFTPHGGRIEVRLEPGSSGTAAWEEEKAISSSHPPRTDIQLSVSDTGQGIAPDFLPHVFDYFRQADSTTTRRFGGLGLGLAIVRYLVELHGGTVAAASPGEGQGATFTVKLPAIAAASLQQTDTLSSPGSEVKFNGLQVLVVDDDRDSRELITFLLQQQGAIITEVASASEALSCLEQASFDLLISDIGMPAIDGYGLIRHIRKQSPDQGGKVPAIALTAYASEIDQQHALAAGFQHHLTKPVESELLMQTIWTLVENKGSRIN
ncbi:MAG TPA: response regulator, partial [Coleofasciculaceae cyanobacterium]